MMLVHLCNRLAAEDCANHSGIVLEATAEIGLTRENLNRFRLLPQTADEVLPTKILSPGKAETLMDVGR